jgi:hypothetical protein
MSRIVNIRPAILTNFIFFLLFPYYKKEASGYLTWVKKEIEKEKFIDNCEQAYGYRLNNESIEKNPGRRYIGKLGLNSGWGRLCMNEVDMVRYKCITKVSDWLEMISN